MKKLSLKIVDKLTRELQISERTLRENIYSLSKDNLGTTLNARAYLYGQKRGINIFGFLDTEDKVSLTSNDNTASRKVQIKKAQVSRGLERRSVKRKEKTPRNNFSGFFDRLTNPQKFMGAITVGLIIFILGFFIQRVLSNLYPSEPGFSPSTSQYGK